MITQLVEENKEISEKKEMKSQITKLTSALTINERGKFPSQSVSNPKGQYMAETLGSKHGNLKEVNAIVTRSNKVLEGPCKSSEDQATTSSNSEDISLKEEEPRILVKAPFNQAMKMGKTLEIHDEILEHLK